MRAARDRSELALTSGSRSISHNVHGESDSTQARFGCEPAKTNSSAPPIGPPQNQTKCHAASASARRCAAWLAYCAAIQTVAIARVAGKICSHNALNGERQPSRHEIAQNASATPRPRAASVWSRALIARSVTAPTEFERGAPHRRRRERACRNRENPPCGHCVCWARSPGRRTKGLSTHLRWRSGPQYAQQTKVPARFEEFARVSITRNARSSRTVRGPRPPPNAKRESSPCQPEREEHQYCAAKAEKRLRLTQPTHQKERPMEPNFVARRAHMRRQSEPISARHADGNASHTGLRYQPNRATKPRPPLQAGARDCHQIAATPNRRRLWIALSCCAPVERVFAGSVRVQAPARATRLATRTACSTG